MFTTRVLERATKLAASALIFGLINFVTSHAKSDACKITQTTPLTGGYSARFVIVRIAQFDKLRGQAETKVLSEIGLSAILLPTVKTSKSVDKVGGLPTKYLPPIRAMLETVQWIIKAVQVAVRLPFPAVFAKSQIISKLEPRFM